MKIQEVGFYAVIIIFRCIAIILFGTGIISIAGALFAFNSVPSAAFGTIFAKVILVYAAAGIVAWFGAKPIARIMVADFPSGSGDKGDLLRESLR